MIVGGNDMAVKEKKVQVECKYCGKQFVPKGQQKYCNEKCWIKYYAKKGGS